MARGGGHSGDVYIPFEDIFMYKAVERCTIDAAFFIFLDVATFCEFAPKNARRSKHHRRKVRFKKKNYYERQNELENSSPPLISTVQKTRADLYMACF